MLQRGALAVGADSRAGKAGVDASIWADARLDRRPDIGMTERLPISSNPHGFDGGSIARGASISGIAGSRSIACHVASESRCPVQVRRHRGGGVLEDHLYRLHVRPGGDE